MVFLEVVDYATRRIRFQSWWLKSFESLCSFFVRRDIDQVFLYYTVHSIFLREKEWLHGNRFFYLYGPDRKSVV